MRLIKILFVTSLLIILPFAVSCDAEFDLPCQHSEVSKEIIVPSCTEEGMTVNTCLSCGYSFNTDLSSPTGHDFKSEVVSADCDKGGYTVYTCECGETYSSDYTSALEHDYKSWVTKPTCDKEGYTTYVCYTCDHTYVADSVKPLGHDMESVKTEPTCMHQGFTTYSCTRCDHSYVSDYVQPLGHSLEASITAPTCDKAGFTAYSCTVCDYNYVSDHTAPTGHIFTESTVVDATCTTEGTSKYVCACGEEYVLTVYPTGHNFSKSVVSPTVKDMGYTSYSCECGFSYNGNYRFYSEIVDDAYADGDQVIARGIDISKWNHKYDSNDEPIPFDWVALKDAGVDYVILKIGSTLSGLEPTFEMDYAGAKAAGIDVGVYFFTYSTSVSQIKQDAETLLTWLDGKQFEYPIYLDVEDTDDGSYKPSEIAAPILTEMCLEFFSILQAEGYYTGLYINNELLYNIMQTANMIDLFDIWYARYPYAAEGDDFTVDNNSSWKDAWVVDENGAPRRFGMWQYSMTGVLEGITESVDFNYSYKDYPKIICELGMNGFTLK